MSSELEMDSVSENAHRTRSRTAFGPTSDLVPKYINVLAEFDKLNRSVVNLRFEPYRLVDTRFRTIITHRNLTLRHVFEEVGKITSELRRARLNIFKLRRAFSR